MPQTRPSGVHVRSQIVVKTSREIVQSEAGENEDKSLIGGWLFGLIHDGKSAPSVTQVCNRFPQIVQVFPCATSRSDETRGQFHLEQHDRFGQP
jgi:hypothetical protein